MMLISHGLAACRDGEVIGTGFATLFDEHTASISLIIVDAAMRGKGFGRELMNRLLDVAGARESRLVATPDGLSLYQKLGFREVRKIHQHQAVISNVTHPDGVGWWSTPDVAHLVALDRAAFGADRSAIITRACELGEVAVLGASGTPSAFAIVRPFGKGKVVGPVIAQGEAQAKALIAFALAENEGSFMRTDVPQDCGLSPWLEGLGLVCVDRVVAMVRQPHPASTQPRSRVFGLFNQALG